MSWSVMYFPYSYTAKCIVMQFGTKNPTLSDSVNQLLALPFLLHVIALRGNRLRRSIEDRHKCEHTVQKSHKILTVE